MANYVILDTSIYRELGLKFFVNLDYKNLHSFTMNTDGEVLLSNIVFEEFCNFYKSHLRQKTASLLRASKDLERDPFFNSRDLIENDIEKEFQNALLEFQKALRNDPVNEVSMAILRPTMISGLELTKFILESKETKDSNIQIRDYLIWDSVLSFAKNESEDKIEHLGKRKITYEKSVITFITKDKGFEENILFQELKKTYNVNNIEVEKSITDFLEKKGFYFDFITDELIIQKILPSRIIKDLSKDIGALLSYVSERYHHNCYEKEIVDCIIEKIEVVENYTYLDSKDRKHKFTAQLKVWVNAVFEKDELGFKESTEKLRERDYYGRSLETYDEMQRPYFHKPILFFYGGLVNIERKSIKSIKFLDYMPDMYLNENE